MKREVGSQTSGPFEMYTYALDAVGLESLVIPGGHLLLRADFFRLGDDLILRGSGEEAGQSVRVTSYFSQPNPPTLQTVSGAQISADLAAHLAGPVAPGMEVMAGGEGVDSTAIGYVETLVGEVVVVRSGLKLVAEKGMALQEGDRLETGEEGRVGLVYGDDTTVSLGGNGRMVIEEMSYDPAAGVGRSSTTVVQGTFSFVSGGVAKLGEEAMVFKTPVAQIGVRGTTVAGTAGAEGSENSFTLLQDADGGVGSISVTNSAGTQLLSQPNQTTTVTSFFVSPVKPFLISSAQVEQHYGATIQARPTPSRRSRESEDSREEDAEAQDEGEGEPVEEQPPEKEEEKAQNTAGEGEEGPGEGEEEQEQEKKPSDGEGKPQPEGDDEERQSPPFDGEGLADEPDKPEMESPKRRLQQEGEGREGRDDLAPKLPLTEGQEMPPGEGALSDGGPLSGLNLTTKPNVPAGDQPDGPPPPGSPVFSPGKTWSGEMPPLGPAGSQEKGYSFQVNPAGGSEIDLTPQSFSAPERPPLNQSSQPISQPSRDDGGGYGEENPKPALTSEPVLDATSEPTPTPTAQPALPTKGSAIDGYIKNALVFADADNDGVLDGSENHTQTDDNGDFSLVAGNHPLVVKGGIDISTGLSFTGLMKAPPGATMVTPLTSLMVELVNAGVASSAGEAESILSHALGIPAGSDLLHLDPIQAVKNGDANGPLIMSAAIQVQNTVAQAAAVLQGADSQTDEQAAFQAVFKSLAAKIQTAGTSINLTDATQMEDLITRAAKDSLGFSGDTLTRVESAMGHVALIITHSNGTAKLLESQSGESLLAQLAKVAHVAQGTGSEWIRQATDPDNTSFSFGDGSDSGVLNALTHGLGTLVNDAQVNQSDGTTSTTTATITPPTANYIPIVTGVVTSSTLEDTDLSGQTTASDSDGDTLTYTVLSQGSHGSATIDDSSGAWQYTPDTDYHGTDSFSIRVDDGNQGKATQTIQLTIDSVNDAPTLDISASPAFIGVAVNDTNPLGMSVADLVVDGSFSDDDLDSESIAITYIDNSFGSWQFSIDGGSHWDVMSQTAGAAVDLTASARLLSADDLLRFVSDGVTPGDYSLRFRAWDQSVGSPGETLDASSTGGDTPFSIAEESATIHVDANGQNHHTQATDSSWHTASNWSMGVLPTAAHDVTLAATGTRVSHDDGSVTPLFSLTANEDLTLSNGGVLEISQASTIAAGKTLSVEEGILRGTGLLNVSGTLASHEGTISLATHLDAGGTFKANQSGQTIAVEGAFSTDANSTILVGQGGGDAHGTLTFASGFINAGTLKIDNDSSASMNSSLSVTSGSLANTGTIQSLDSNGGGGSRTLTADILNGIGGTLDIDANLTLVGNLESSLGTIDILAGKILTLSGTTLGVDAATTLTGGGTIALSGNSTLSVGAGGYTHDTSLINLSLDSGAVTTTGSGTLSVTGDWNLRGTNDRFDVVVDKSATGTLTLQANNSYGDSTQTFSKGLINSGSLSLAGYNYNDVLLTIGADAVLDNSGTLSVDGDFYGSKTLAGSVTNRGILQLNGDSLTITNSDTTFDTTSGTINLNSGYTLTINQGTVLFGADTVL
ncbi:MAG: cadherin-like domain-containing protein, partial [Magnetococcales bacterium]|nr:cadherin-like domain-containing protein [Magnetococcales bacterium]